MPVGALHGRLGVQRSGLPLTFIREPENVIHPGAIKVFVGGGPPGQQLDSEESEPLAESLPVAGMTWVRDRPNMTRKLKFKLSLPCAY